MENHYERTLVGYARYFDMLNMNTLINFLIA